LRNKALIAFGIAFLVQLLYLAFRFKWTFGLSAVLAMFHDVLIVTGVFAWLQKPIDGVFLAAAMTIIGLSVNDTVVVFDRIRERWYASRGESFDAVANKACCRDHAAYGQHRSGRDVHPRSARRSSVAIRCATSRSRCCWV
jgi:SecD/SecF fusion protein